MTDAQLEKATRLTADRGLPTVTYRKASIEDTGLPGESFDCVISNGVIYRKKAVRNADLWAACIGGAPQRQDYGAAIESAGLRVERLEDNVEYRFISERAQKATAKWGVKSVSMPARNP
jgi:hypothetical protein